MVAHKVIAGLAPDDWQPELGRTNSYRSLLFSEGLLGILEGIRGGGWSGGWSDGTCERGLFEVQ